MKKESIVMVSSKVLAQMLAYRKYNRYYASYKEACESLETDIEKFRKDPFRVNLIKQNIPSSPSVFAKSFQTLVINIAAKCLLTADECSGQHLMYNEIFDTLFEVTGEMMDQLIEEGNQYYDSTILDKFENFKAGIDAGHANTVLLYQIAAYCLFLHNYIEVSCKPHKTGDKFLVTVTPAGIKLINRVYFDIKLKDYLNQEVFVITTHINNIIDVYSIDGNFICSAYDITELAEVKL